jgi:hypothetical protein
MLARGTKDKEHAMLQKLNNEIAVSGRKGVSHCGENRLLMSESGQNEKPPFSGLCQLPPAATDIALA